MKEERAEMSRAYEETTFGEAVVMIICDIPRFVIRKLLNISAKEVSR